MLDGVSVTPSESGLATLSESLGAVQSVLMSLHVRDQFGTTTESLFGVGGSWVVVRVLGPDRERDDDDAEVDAEALVLADARLDDLTDSVVRLGNESTFKAVDEVLSVLQTISTQANLVV